MIKIFVLMLAFVTSFNSHAHVRFTDLKGMHEMVVDKRFSLVNPFLALNAGILERIRFYGPYVLDGEGSANPGWIHRAFLIKEGRDPHAFSKRFEYPLDAVSALIQWLFPSVDGALFVANDRKKDIIGDMGRSLKEVSHLPNLRDELKILQKRLHIIQVRQTQEQEDLIATIDAQIAKLTEKSAELTETPKKLKRKPTQEELDEKKKIKAEIANLRQQKDQTGGSIAIITAAQMQEKSKLIQELEFMPKILRCIHEGMSDPSYERFRRCLGIGPHPASSSSTSVQPQDQRTTFIEILYNALLMDGTFGKKKSKDGPLVYSHNPLYPKHIALHALLGYIWHVCDSKVQVIAVMREAGLLKIRKAHEHRLERVILEQERYTKADYELIKNKEHPTFEELAFVGYGYEIYGAPNPEMITYSQADINVTEKDLQQYPYLSTHKPYPDCGETALRNFFNLITFKGAGEFDGNLLPQINTSHMEKIRKFYHDFPDISSQKQSLANTAWGTIVSNLNGTSTPSSNPMDVMYSGYRNIKSSLGIKNILNVMAKLTGDSVLNEMWREEDEGTHIAKKLTHLCKMFSRGQEFEITWEINSQTEKAPIHGDFKLIVTRRGFAYNFIFNVVDGHFNMIPLSSSLNDERKTKFNRVDNDLLKPFYDQNPPPFPQSAHKT